MAAEQEYELSGMLTEDCQYLHLTSWKVFQRTLRKWVGKELLISVKVLRYKRSDKQNRYMWGILIPYTRKWLWDTQGENYTNDEVYLWLRISLLGEKPKVVNIAGQEIITTSSKRFSQMTTAEFAEAVDTILREMAARGCIIPEPSQGKHTHNLIEEFIIDE